MAAFTRRNLTDWIAPAGGAGVGLVVAAVFLLMPVGSLENLVWRSGIAALVPVAAPPLGATARAVLSLGGGLLAAAIAWSALFLLFGPGGLVDLSRPGAQDDMPVLRRADAHPDAPPRKPLSARDLGTPMPPVAPRMPAPAPVVASVPVLAPATVPVTVEARPIPADLDQPLAAFDPAALPAAPLAAVRPVASLTARTPLDRGERIASVELPAMPHDDGGSPSIEQLLRRLEQSTRRRVAAR